MADGQGNLAGVPPVGEKKSRADRTRIRDRELKAIERIMRILGELEEEEGAARVVRYLAERHDFVIEHANG